MTQHVETLGTVVHAMCRHVRQYAAACKCEALLMCFPRHRFIGRVASGRDFQIVCNATEQFKKLLRRTLLVRNSTTKVDHSERPCHPRMRLSWIFLEPHFTSCQNISPMLHRF